MEFSGENLLFPVLKIFDTKCVYNFIHQNLKTIQELNDQNNNDGNDMGCERDNVGRPINDFTWFSIVFHQKLQDFIIL